eukprot:31286-Pelagococcus_subviridis.AAC.17
MTGKTLERRRWREGAPSRSAVGGLSPRARAAPARWRGGEGERERETERARRGPSSDAPDGRMGGF